MRTIFRYLFAAVAVLFVAGVVFQVFLAGMFLFAGGDRDTHIEFGFLLPLVPMIALLLMWPAHVGRRLGWMTVALVVVTIVQTMLPGLKTDLPIVAALHPVNALLVLWLGVRVAQEAVALARNPIDQSAPEPARAALGQQS
jgi:Family of unknown function (DUF6220)